MLDIIFSNINLFTPIFLALGIALGVFLGIFLSKPRKHQIMKILPSDNRGYQFDIARENAFSIFCKGFDNLPDQRFIKSASSITLKIKRLAGRTQQLTRYLGREGTAYVQKAASEVKNIPFHKAFRTMVGEEFYDQIPDKQKKIIEEDKVGVTVGLTQQPLTPLKADGEPMPSISEEDIKREEDKAASATFWREKATAGRNTIVQSIAWIGFGFGICMVINLLMGWIKIV